MAMRRAAAAALLALLLALLAPYIDYGAGSWYGSLRRVNTRLLKFAQTPHMRAAYCWWPWDLCTVVGAWWWSGSFLYADPRSRQVFMSSGVAKPAGALRVVAIADSHLYHRRLWLPDGDVLVFSGDALTEWRHGWDDMRDFVAWFASQPHAHKFFIGGNNDLCLVNASARQLDDLLGEAAGTRLLRGDLEHGAAKVQGATREFTFFGAPWSLKMNPTSMPAFQIAAGDPAWQSIPASVNGSRVDVLLTHGPPAGILDNGLGGEDLRQVVEETAPRVHVFGHEHEDHGVHFGKSTTFINAAVVDDFFCAVRRPIVIDLL